MTEARQKDEWQRTSSMIAMIANTVRDTKKRPKPFEPKDFDPFAPKPKPVKVGIGVLKDIFINQREPVTLTERIKRPET